MKSNQEKRYLRSEGMRRGGRDPATDIMIVICTIEVYNCSNIVYLFDLWYMVGKPLVFKCFVVCGSVILQQNIGRDDG